MLGPRPPESASAPALERWLAAHRRPVVALLLAAAVAVRLALCAEIAGGPIPVVHTIVSESDGAFFQRWGESIARGDLVQRSPLHPTYTWMREVADLAVSLDGAWDSAGHRPLPIGSVGSA